MNVADSVELQQRRKRVMSSSYRLFYRHPVHLVRGEGVWLYDANGLPHLDAYNNVPTVGHGNPVVAAAMARQALQLNAHTRYLSDEIVDYGARLLDLFDPELDRITFTCTGSEANDLASRLAREHTGALGVIVTANAYHGVTSTISAMSPSLTTELDPTVRAVPVPEPALGPAAGARFANGVRDAIADLERHGHRVAMLLVDTVMSSDGIIPDPIGVLNDAVAAVRAAGGLYVADEVQAGFGRLGDGMWGFSRHALVPDVVTLGKPMGNGYPLAGAVSRAEISGPFGEKFRYFNTFGGSSVAAAVGMAVLDEIEDRTLIDSCAEVGRYLRAGLRELAADRDMVGDIRGAGLFAGVDIRSPDRGSGSRTRAEAVVDGMRQAGVLISATGPDGATLKIRPPLVFGREHADLLLERLSRVLSDVASSAPEPDART